MDEDRPRTRVILHVDLDAFYCQVEHVRLGIPTSVPLCVQQWNGLIAVNYAARAAGIKRHCTTEEALVKCSGVFDAPTYYSSRETAEEQILEPVSYEPPLLVATYANGETEPKYHTEGVSALTHKVSLEPYRRASAKIMKIFQRYCQKFQRASIDEAYLDVTEEVNNRIARLNLVETADSGADADEPLVNWEGAGYIVGEEVTESFGWHDLALRIGAAISQEIRDAVFKELRYTCSCGIAHNKTLAKLCSALNKPNKQTVLRESQVLQFMEKLPMSSIRNLGGKLGAEVESELKVETAGDLW
ncbi:DNA-directed DNA polymerase eta rad30 [Rhizophlyctis rosea]|uniref:DNA-directed DNA polymerase eta rad30 n=1 Tax=Rhizophlyctis rosea TaxID=64517 RepID=A0AAD5WXV4_9FUNG|nr:DNA-directed DNA polymerase eta rad30 [Rhizophlyctis rosea]